MSLRELYRCANVDRLSEVLGVPIRIASEEHSREQLDALKQKSKLVNTTSKAEFYEYEEDEPMEVDIPSPEEHDASPSASRRSLSDKLGDSKNSSGDQSQLGIDPPIFSPFDPEHTEDPLNWPKEANLRLLSMVAIYGVFANNVAETIYYGFLSERMCCIKSDEPGLHEYCVDKEDWEKIGKNPPTELKPSYEVRPTPDECKEKMTQFYNMEYIKTKINYYDKATPFDIKKEKNKATPSGSNSSLSRSRRTGRPNPLVEAMVEEKKLHKRGSMG